MRRSASIVSLAIFALLMFGCVNDHPEFFIAGSIIPELEDDGCSLDPGGSLLTRGVLNVDVNTDYRLFPLYSNQIRSRLGDGTANPSGIQVRGAEIELLDEAGNSLGVPGPNPFLEPESSTFVPATDDGNEPGQAVGELRIIPSAYRGSLAGGTTVVVKVEAFGETLGGIDVEAGPFFWVVELCNGTCLFACDMGADPMDIAGCTPGQDSVTLSPLACPMP